MNVAGSWTVIKGANGYKLYYAPFPYTGPETINFIDMGNETSFVYELWNGAAFYTAITAYSDTVESEYSNIELIIID